MLTLSQDQVRDLRAYQGVEDGAASLAVEASEIGIRPGQPWPDAIIVGDPASHVRFDFLARDVRGGELQGVRYRSAAGDKLLVIND